MHFTPEIVRQSLRTVDTEATRQVEQNADLLNLFAAILNGSLAALDGKTPGEIKTAAILGAIDKNASLAGFVGKADNSKNLMLGSTVVQLSAQSLTLLKLGANATPGQVLATAGAMFTKKVALALGLAENDKQAKVIAAFSDCASSVLSVGLAVSAATTPVGWVLVGAAFVQLGASAYQTYAATNDGK